jgi:hypothetical protein
MPNIHEYSATIARIVSIGSSIYMAKLTVLFFFCDLSGICDISVSPHLVPYQTMDSIRSDDDVCIELIAVFAVYSNPIGAVLDLLNFLASPNFCLIPKVVV